jgi:hypothetical protein
LKCGIEVLQLARVTAEVMHHQVTERSAMIEALEHRYMRAWMSRDKRLLKASTSSKFRVVVGTKPCVMLDAKSWLDAATHRFLCSGYRFGDVYTHDLGSVVIFATQFEAQMTLDGKNWDGQFWLSDVWRRSSIRRTWNIFDRTIARLETDTDVSAAIRGLQLWGRKPSANSVMGTEL